jgi:hypothetical protein
MRFADYFAVTNSLHKFMSQDLPLICDAIDPVAGAP